ncbi:hypothetical protein DJ568_03070 [Mucilaginibacter hurinus]|uniref:Uncharacterized protein n=2 Tax=Mucilaginibacter hurinus TaxID=2201324 RepID=A0A367GTW2_9SPHI|nr:hypothetical protein DJ568_03070 [Mucilaginibacter hurinus]
MDLEPCKDGINIASQTVSILTAAHTQHSAPVQDQCPPMCHCSCCSVQLVIAKKLVIQPLTVVDTPVQMSFIPEKPVTRPTNVWQPPKLNA